MAKHQAIRIKQLCFEKRILLEAPSSFSSRALSKETESQRHRRVDLLKTLRKRGMHADRKEFRVRLQSSNIGGMQWPAEIVRRNTGSCCIARFITPLAPRFNRSFEWTLWHKRGYQGMLVRTLTSAKFCSYDWLLVLILCVALLFQNLNIRFVMRMRIVFGIFTIPTNYI